MATFTIKRGDSMPPLIIALRVAGSDPLDYWDISKDDVGLGGLSKEDNAPSPPSTYVVKFIMREVGTRRIVGLPANVAEGFTGLGVIYEKFADPPTNSIKQTILRYNWRAPHPDFDPSLETQASADIYGGDTAKAGTYDAEFEIFYAETPGANTQKFKRTFPGTSGDFLAITIDADLNDKLKVEDI